MEVMGGMNDSTVKKWSIASWEFVFGIVALVCTCFGVFWGIYSYYYSATVEAKETMLNQVITVKQERLDLAREQLEMAKADLAKADSAAQVMIDSLTAALQAQITREEQFQTSINSLPSAVRSSQQIQRVFTESQQSAEKTSQAVNKLNDIKALRTDISKIQLFDPKTDAAVDRLLQGP